MTRVIHTGDTHLGYRQYHRPERREDFLAAFRQVIEDAVAGDVDAVVHAGDLFHDRRPDLEDIMGALSALRDLAEADIPFLAVVGNHEAKRDAQWLDLYASLGLAIRLGAEPVEIGNTAFYGLDFVPRSRRDDLDPGFEPTDAEYAALVTHGLFEPFEFGEWDPREIFEAADVGFDALLLGDNHDPGTKQVEGVWVTYCGSTERASAAEREDRGYNLVTFDEGVDIRRRGLDTRAFVFVDVDLDHGEGIERVRDRLGEYDLDGAVAVVTIDGEGDPVTPASIEEYAIDRGALVARVTDRREATDEDDREVSFADPDDAVRERVRELGLSEAARGIDETVRASTVADSNVADEVESRVETLVEEGDLDAFVAAGVGDESDGPDGETADDTDGESTDTADGESTDATDGESTDATDGESADATETGETTTGDEAGEDKDKDDGEDESDESSDGKPAGHETDATLGDFA